MEKALGKQQSKILSWAKNCFFAKCQKFVFILLKNCHRKELLTDRLTVWPDVEIKSSPRFSESCRKKPRLVLLKDVALHFNPKSNHQFGYFLKRICHQDFSKIAQSGHTSWPTEQPCKVWRIFLAPSVQIPLLETDQHLQPKKLEWNVSET